MLKRIGIVLLAAVIVGVIFTFGPYYYYLKADRYSRTHEFTDSIISSESGHFLRLRFYIGAGVGAGLAVLGIFLTRNDPPEKRPEEPRKPPAAGP